MSATVSAAIYTTNSGALTINPALLPTTDPGEPGALWNNGGALCYSAATGPAGQPAGTLPITTPIYISTRGNVVLAPSLLPAADPGVGGALWNDGGTIAVSLAAAPGTVGNAVLIAQLTLAERVACRRFLGYPAYGNGASGEESWRFFGAYGELEYRLSNLTAEELDVLRATFLANLTTLEAALPAVGGNLDTAKAAVWTHNPNELRDREALLELWALRFAGFLGVPPGPALGVARGRRIV